ncbi:MAG TPA: hypothetical protein VGP72_31965 [Planctomycetota bacterium]|jgi:hypothetical protein
MDALTRETITKNIAVVSEMLPMFDGQDMGQGFAVVRAIREKTSANAKAAEDKLLELAPAAGKAKIQDILKQQANERDRMTRWGGGGAGGAPVKPPHPARSGQEGGFLRERESRVEKSRSREGPEVEGMAGTEIPEIPPSEIPDTSP